MKHKDTIKIEARGNTYPVKEELKTRGMRWWQDRWLRSFPATLEGLAETLAFAEELQENFKGVKVNINTLDGIRNDEVRVFLNALLSIVSPFKKYGELSEEDFWRNITLPQGFSEEEVKTFIQKQRR